MANTTISKSMSVIGQMGETYGTLVKKLPDLGFTESASTWPTDLEFKRGKRGMFAKNLKDIKTVLKISLKQSDNNVNLFFEFNFGVPKSFIDPAEIDKEFEKMKSEIADASEPVPTTITGKICEICTNPIPEGEKFCKFCGRKEKEETMVTFDDNKIPFGQKIVDDSLYGGIPNNGVLLITSPACEEKDIILTRFMETGLEQSEVVVYVTTENRLSENEKIGQNEKFYQVICNSQIDLASSKCITENCIQVKGVERLTELSVALTSLLNNISKKMESQQNSQRLVIDVLSDTLLCNQSINTRKWLRETITKFKQKNFTTLAVLNPHMHTKEETQSLLDLFDGQIDIYEKENEAGNTYMFMKVKRLNNSRYSTKEIQLLREDMLLQRN